jgi:hypothetical protein
MGGIFKAGIGGCLEDEPAIGSRALNGVSEGGEDNCVAFMYAMA